ncbi:MAG: penicillin acylase family protein, partial [Candidatus Cloacimonadaceae bacterium]|nr:penicillin acylase family protein [Candidatus Cloacimonadaceae bacterium]
MLYKSILMAGMLMTLTACSLILTKPVKKTLPQRLAEFPSTDIPLEKAAEIRWNDFQVPYIKAQTDRDCALLLGMTHAHLRLGQMNLFREIVNARAAMRMGPFATNIDHLILVMDIGAAVDEMQKDLPAETGAWLSAFTQGINLYQSRMKELPAEMRALKIKPEPWTVRDILMIGRLVSADVNWFNYFSLLPAQSEPFWQEYWQRILALGTGSTPSSAAIGIRAEDIFLGMSKSGSNAFAVSSQKSGIGAAVMASDPHLGLMLPNMWLIAGYECPSYKVVGLMFPALPAVLVGRNEQISFSGTNMRSASSELIELDEDDIAALKIEPHRIIVKGWLDKKILIRRSVHGPVISDAKFLKANGKTFALKWVGHSPSDEISAMLAMNRASDFDEFKDAFGSYAVSGQNFLYADVKGDVGLVPAVRIPIRDYVKPPSLAFAADDSSNGWKGFLTSKELPHIFRPESGFVASANNVPFKAQTPLGFFFSANDRIDRMNQVLGDADQVGFDLIRDLHLDSYVGSARENAHLMAEYLTSKSANYSIAEHDVISQLASWDGYYEADQKAPVIHQLMLYHFVSEYYAKKYNKAFASKILSSDSVNELASEDLRKRKDAELLPVMESALKRTVKAQRKYANWGEMHRLRLDHYFGRIPLIGGRYRFGEYPSSGSSNSLMKTAHTVSNKKHTVNYGANARFIAFMDDDSHNLFALLGSQDGWLGSERFGDQIPLWQ